MIFDRKWIRNFLIDKMVKIFSVIGVATTVDAINNALKNPNLLKVSYEFESMVDRIYDSMQTKILMGVNVIVKLVPIPFVTRIITTFNNVLFMTLRWKNRMKSVEKIAHKLKDYVNIANSIPKAITQPLTTSNVLQPIATTLGESKLSSTQKSQINDIVNQSMKELLSKQQEEIKKRSQKELKKEVASKPTVGGFTSKIFKQQKELQKNLDMEREKLNSEWIRQDEKDLQEEIRMENARDNVNKHRRLRTTRLGGKKSKTKQKMQKSKTRRKMQKSKTKRNHDP